MELVPVLHNIRSVHNVGSIFRTGDGAGVSRLWLTGYTPAPIDRFGRIRDDLAKVSLGAERRIPWQQAADLSTAIIELKDAGFLILALEQHPQSCNIFDFTFPEGCKKAALIVGNEVEGISEDELSEADAIIEIPMQGTKESLNVSVATGIALYTIRQDFRK